jgi:hypothetical protein
MEIKEIKNFIKYVNNVILKIPNNIIEDYIIYDNEIPLFFNWTLDYNGLKEIHTRLINTIYDAKTLVLIEEDEAEKYIYELIRLKLLIDNLIRNHPKAGKLSKGKFEKDYLKQIEDGEINFLKFHSKEKHTKLNIIIKLYKNLIKLNRVENSNIQRKAFIALFFKDKIINTQLKWNGVDSDLRAFLKVLVDLKLNNNLSDINTFAVKNFKNINSKGIYKEINYNTFKSYQDKSQFYKLCNEWEIIITNL